MDTHNEVVVFMTQTMQCNLQKNRHKIPTPIIPDNCFVACRWAKYCEQRVGVSVCLFACLFARISKNTHIQISLNFLHVLPKAVARSSFDGNVIRYVLPILWTTSCLYKLDRMGQNHRRRVCFVEFARWRHQRRSCRLRWQTC